MGAFSDSFLQRNFGGWDSNEWSTDSSYNSSDNEHGNNDFDEIKYNLKQC